MAYGLNAHSSLVKDLNLVPRIYFSLQMPIISAGHLKSSGFWTQYTSPIIPENSALFHN